MKKSLIIFLILYNFTLLAQENHPNKNLLTTIIGAVDKRDLNCFSEIEKAKLDFKTKETYYYIESEAYLDADYNRHHIILRELLKKKGISFLTSTKPDSDSNWIDNDEEKYQLKTNCYCKSFNELLNLKYGHNFTKNIEHTADSLYVMSRIDLPFKYPYGVDNYCMIYPSAKEFLDQKEHIKKDFFSSFKFPKNFIYTEEKRDFMAKTKFTIHRDATISDIEIKIQFKNPKNQKFNDYIFKQLTTFIKNANWKAAVSSNIKVNSIFEINFYN